MGRCVFQPYDPDAVLAKRELLRTQSTSIYCSPDLQERLSSLGNFRVGQKLAPGGQSAQENIEIACRMRQIDPSALIPSAVVDQKGRERYHCPVCNTVHIIQKLEQHLHSKVHTNNLARLLWVRRKDLHGPQGIPEGSQDVQRDMTPDRASTPTNDWTDNGDSSSEVEYTENSLDSSASSVSSPHYQPNALPQDPLAVYRPYYADLFGASKSKADANMQTGPSTSQMTFPSLGQFSCFPLTGRPV